jgi:hypothetical protein
MIAEFTGWCAVIAWPAFALFGAFKTEGAERMERLGARSFGFLGCRLRGLAPRVGCGPRPSFSAHISKVCIHENGQPSVAIVSH